LALDPVLARVTTRIRAEADISAGIGRPSDGPVSKAVPWVPIGAGCSSSGGTIGLATVLHVGTYEKPIVFQNAEGGATVPSSSRKMSDTC